jgi:hypothetical protein
MCLLTVIRRQSSVLGPFLSRSPPRCTIVTQLRLLTANNLLRCSVPLSKTKYINNKKQPGYVNNRITRRWAFVKSKSVQAAVYWIGHCVNGIKREERNLPNCLLSGHNRREYVDRFHRRIRFNDLFLGFPAGF